MWCVHSEYRPYSSSSPMTKHKLVRRLPSENAALNKWEPTCHFIPCECSVEPHGRMWRRRANAFVLRLAPPLSCTPSSLFVIYTRGCQVQYSLTSIRGVGRRFANLICKKAEVDPNKRWVTDALCRAARAGHSEMPCRPCSENVVRRVLQGTF